MDQKYIPVESSSFNWEILPDFEVFIKRGDKIHLYFGSSTPAELFRTLKVKEEFLFIKSTDLDEYKDYIKIVNPKKVDSKKPASAPSRPAAPVAVPVKENTVTFFSTEKLAVGFKKITHDLLVELPYDYPLKNTFTLTKDGLLFEAKGLFLVGEIVEIYIKIPKFTVSFYADGIVKQVAKLNRIGLNITKIELRLTNMYENERNLLASFLN